VFENKIVEPTMSELKNTPEAVTVVPDELAVIEPESTVGPNGFGTLLRLQSRVRSLSSNEVR
jgi:hypothetical protein